MKRIIKRIGKLILLIVLIVFLIYFCFRVKEYFVGNRYVKYLKNNTETIETGQPLVFESLDENFYKNNLFLVGEIHEVASSQQIDFSIFKQLHEKINVKTYIAEMDIAQSYYLNKYIQDSTDLDLEIILKEWVVYIGRYNKDYYDKWDKFKDYYLQLLENEKFEIVGIERISDFELLRKLLIERLHVINITIPQSDKLIEWGVHEFPGIIVQLEGNIPDNDLVFLKNIQFNLKHYETIKNRDEWMYENFKRNFKQRNWIDKKLYGCFGFYHTLGGLNTTFAGRLRKNKQIAVHDQFVSMNGLYIDSYLTVPSEGLPSLLRDKGTFTRFNFSYDNMLTMYIVGIEDFKRVTPKNSISLIKLNGENSPYLNSLRGTANFSLLPLWQGIDFKDKNSVTTDYVQYVFFVRNADWSKPFTD